MNWFIKHFDEHSAYPCSDESMAVKTRSALITYLILIGNWT